MTKTVRRRPVASGLVCVLAMLFGRPAGAETTVLTVEGHVRVGTLAALDAKGARLVVAGKRVSVAAPQLQEIRFAEKVGDALGRPGVRIVQTVDGSRLVVRRVVLADGRITVDTALMGRKDLPLERVASLLLPDAKTAPQAVQAEARALLDGLPESGGDYLVARGKSGKYVAVCGVLKSIDARKITFNYDGEDRTVDIARAPFVRVAGVAGPSTPPNGWVVATDGTRLSFAGVAMGADGAFGLQGTCLGELDLPGTSTAVIRFRNDNVVYLSDLTPVAVLEAGTFGEVFRYRRDASAANRPIRLDGRTFSRGLGLHSRCELTYGLGGKYKRFVALAGIDDASRPAGNATLTVLGDGRALLPTVRLTGKGKALPVRLGVSGVKKLTLVVGFGEDFDVGDHVDLADAKLIK